MLGPALRMRASDTRLGLGQQGGGCPEAFLTGGQPPHVTSTRFPSDAALPETPDAGRRSGPRQQRRPVGPSRVSRGVHLRDLAKPATQGRCEWGARVRRIVDMVSPPSERVLARLDRLSGRLSRTQPKNFLVKVVNEVSYSLSSRWLCLKKAVCLQKEGVASKGSRVTG